MFPEESLYEINQEIDFFSLAFYVTNNSSHFKSYIYTLNVAYETNMERAIVIIDTTRVTTKTVQGPILT